jgi:hypothetical protein
MIYHWELRHGKGMAACPPTITTPQKADLTQRCTGFSPNDQILDDSLFSAFFAQHRLDQMS